MTIAPPAAYGSGPKARSTTVRFQGFLRPGLHGYETPHARARDRAAKAGSRSRQASDLDEFHIRLELVPEPSISTKLPEKVCFRVVKREALIGFE